MSFLLPFLQPRSSKSNLSSTAAAVEELQRAGTPQSASGSEGHSRSSTPAIPAQQRPLSASPTPTTSGVASVETERPSRSRSPRQQTTSQSGQKKDTRRRSQVPLDLGDRLMGILEQPVPKPYIPTDELDESYHFALSIVPMLQRLNKDKRQYAKVQILTLLHNLDKSTPQHPQFATPSTSTTTWQPVQPSPRLPQAHSSSNIHTSGFQPIPPPPLATPRPIGPFTQMLSSTDEQWEDTSSGISHFPDL